MWGVLAMLLLVSGVMAAPRLPRSFQASELPRDAIAAGYTDVSVGSIALRGTLGQPFVGVSAEGSVTLGHGFWHAEGMLNAIYLPIVLRNSP